MTIEISDKVEFLNGVLCQIDGLYRELLIQNGLTDSTYAVMFALLKLGEGCTQKDIADNTHINKQTINSTIKKLEKDGLLKLKSGKYPLLHIYMTQKCHEFIQEKMVPIINIENKLLEDMPEKDYLMLKTGFCAGIEKLRSLLLPENKSKQ